MGARLGLLLALSIACLGAAGAQTPGDAESRTLRDCSENFSRYYDRPLPEWWDADIDEVIEASSSWAIDACYLPCPFAMCVAVTAMTNSYVVAYVTAEFLLGPESPAASEDPETITVYIAPEVELVISRDDFSVVHATVYHSGCRWRENDCNWESALER
jgi:hypothetical protein